LGGKEAAGTVLMKNASEIDGHDRRFMAAAIRLARRHEGWTATNPSVACLIVNNRANGPVIIGRGVTALGGRPHAEPIALAEAGPDARGATAYVTLEPCAHHGRTPPCAQTLISAGITRVVTAVVDPDERVNDKGHAMLRAAGIEIRAGVEAPAAARGLAAYLSKKKNGRPFITLKLAVSADGLIGIRGKPQVPVTGAIARSQTHLIRARHHAILIGAGTALADDPELTCRLPGLEKHSPVRVVLDPSGRMHRGLKLVSSASRVPLLVVAPPGLGNRAEIIEAGGEILPCEISDGRVALPELLEDLGSRGILSVLVEGGAEIARAFLAEGLVDRIALFEGNAPIGTGHPADLQVPSPILPGRVPEVFRLTGSWEFGDDRLNVYDRKS
jgi:diaminohydroxyphosphoribosylaminopyrimidine deaminase / 5-amino-6-(5-phosphoribosylamino)uracil reductase